MRQKTIQACCGRAARQLHAAPGVQVAPCGGQAVRHRVKAFAGELRVHLRRGPRQRTCSHLTQRTAAVVAPESGLLGGRDALRWRRAEGPRDPSFTLT